MVDLRKKVREYAENVKETVRHPVQTVRRVQENIELASDRRAQAREIAASEARIAKGKEIHRLQKEGKITPERAEQWKGRAVERYETEKLSKGERVVQAGKRAYAVMEAGAEGMERALPPGRAPQGTKSVGKIRAAKQGRIQNLQGGDRGITGLDFRNTPDFSGISGNSKEKRHFAGYSIDFGKLPDFSGGSKSGLPDFSQLDNITSGKKQSRKRR